jgi:phosphoglycolate phosphatase-like HAD superfamily hydrolase
MMRLPDYSAVLFDLDGTLVRTFIDFPAMREDMHYLARKRNQEAAVGDTDDILEMAARLREHGGESLYAEAMRWLIQREEEGCANPERIDGASELLYLLRDKLGVKVAIITRNCRSVSEKLLERMNLPHDLLVAREDTAEFKPHPEPVLRACRNFLTPPSKAIMVGDLWADIASGSAAGVASTIGIRWPYLPKDRFDRCPPDFLVESLLDVSLLLINERTPDSGSD